MDASLLLEYGWVLLVLVGLEGILAADNAIVMAVMVKHLPQEKQKKALLYGLAGAFLFRFSALFLITFLVDVWQIQAIGALYLLYISIHHLIKRKKDLNKERIEAKDKKSSFWMTVLKVEIADIAFAIDSMLASVALAITLKPAGWFRIGGIDGGQFLVMLLGGIIGLIIIRFAANAFVKLLKKYPSLETAAFLIVGWVGIKLAILTLSHEKLGLLDAHFPESFTWKIIFWLVLIMIMFTGYVSARKNNPGMNQGM
ncbi:TerC family protein [Bacillus sp. FJAT-49736]|uniref:TerC family protein n=1 Tax=Bacillus sp. FJAT-49736 TaxID=2833582 RepID=UPI001BC9BE36|nr:TerC family protein [Bacillus sp. FJAT-49736]MBS4172292.1 TerC family protein [Bacillus sp. FJAT-49736]